MAIHGSKFKASTHLERKKYAFSAKHHALIKFLSRMNHVRRRNSCKVSFRRDNRIPIESCAIFNDQWVQEAMRQDQQHQVTDHKSMAHAQIPFHFPTMSRDYVGHNRYNFKQSLYEFRQNRHKIRFETCKRTNRTHFVSFKLFYGD